MMKPILAISLCVATASVSIAQETASIPYRALYEASRIQITDGLDVTEARRTVRFRVQSTRDDVAPTQIKLRLVTNASRQNLAVGENGEFDLPLSDDLANSDAVIQTDQPKGSLKVSAAFHNKYNLNPKIENGIAKIRYVNMFPFNWVHHHAKSISGGNEPDMVHFSLVGATFTNERHNADATVRVVMGETARNVERDAQGQFRLEYDPGTAKRDAWIWLAPPDGWNMVPIRGRHSIAVDQAESGRRRHY